MKTTLKILIAVARILLLLIPGVLTAWHLWPGHEGWVALMAAFGVETVFLIVVSFIYLVSATHNDPRDVKSNDHASDLS